MFVSQSFDRYDYRNDSESKWYEIGSPRQRLIKAKDQAFMPDPWLLSGVVVGSRSRTTWIRCHFGNRIGQKIERRTSICRDHICPGLGLFRNLGNALFTCA